jgi:hypothetical protein
MQPFLLAFVLAPSSSHPTANCAAWRLAHPPGPKTQPIRCGACIVDTRLQIAPGVLRRRTHCPYSRFSLRRRLPQFSRGAQSAVLTIAQCRQFLIEAPEKKQAHRQHDCEHDFDDKVMGPFAASNFITAF